MPPEGPLSRGPQIAFPGPAATGLAMRPPPRRRREPARTAVEDPGAQEGPSWHGALLWRPRGHDSREGRSRGKDLSSRLLAGQWIPGRGREVQGVRIQPRQEGPSQGEGIPVRETAWQGAGGRKEGSPSMPGPSGPTWGGRPGGSGPGRRVIFHRENLAPIGAEGPRLSSCCPWTATWEVPIPTRCAVSWWWMWNGGSGWGTGIRRGDPAGTGGPGRRLGDGLPEATGGDRRGGRDREGGSTASWACP
jgi:hypothetical protein